MGIDQSSQGIMTVDLLPEPDMGNELEKVTNLVRDGGRIDVVVDFSAADIVTSSSIARLLRLRKLLTDYGHRLVFCNASPAIKGIFDIAGLDHVFEFADDKSAALAALENAQHVNS